MFIQFFIPFLVLVVCYGKIVWVLTGRIDTDFIKPQSAMDNSDNLSETTDDVRKTAQAMDPSEEKSVEPGKEKFQLARRNTIKTLLILGVCFIICWSQNQIIYSMYNCGYGVNFNTTYFQFTVVMVFLNCIVNPFIYLIKYRDYQEASRVFFHCIKDERNNNLNSSTIASSSM